MPLSTETHGFIIDPLFSFMDDKGKTIKNGFVRVFLAGSSTPAVTYLNWNGAMNQETIQLDNSGRCHTLVIGAKGTLYKVCVYDSFHSQETPIVTVDNVQVISSVADVVDGAVTTPKIADEAVTTPKIKNKAITEEKLSDSLKLYVIKDYVTPEMFGAKGDGITDDTQALQDAFDSKKPVLLGDRKTYLTQGNVMTNSIILGCGFGSVLKAASPDQDHVLQIESRNKILSNFRINGGGEEVAFGDYGQSVGIKIVGDQVRMHFSGLYITCCRIGINSRNVIWDSDFSKVTLYFCDTAIKGEDEMLECKYDSCSLGQNYYQLDLYKGNNVLFTNCGVGGQTTKRFARIEDSHNVRFLGCNFESAKLDTEGCAFLFEGHALNVVFDGCFIRVVQKNENQTNTALFRTNTGESTSKIEIVNCRFEQNNTVDYHVNMANGDRTIQFQFDWKSFVSMVNSLAGVLSCKTPEVINYYSQLFEINEVMTRVTLPDPAIFGGYLFNGLRVYSQGTLYEMRAGVFVPLSFVEKNKYAGEYILSSSGNTTKWVADPSVYNQLYLKDYVIRIETTEPVTSSDFNLGIDGTLTTIDSNNNIYDIYYPHASWNALFKNNTKLKAVLGANTRKVTSLYETFYGCTNLVSLGLFDTSNVTTMSSMCTNCVALSDLPKFLMNKVESIYGIFQNCVAIISLPEFDFFEITECSYAFYNCKNVFNGNAILTNYEKLSALTPVPTHSNAFTACGQNTVSGAAALSEIPAEWGGTAV